MSAAVFNFALERMKRRPYADNTREDIIFMLSAALNARDCALMDRLTAELKRRNAAEEVKA